MFSSGRMPGDMIIKLQELNYPLLHLNPAPTSSGYMVGDEANVTIIGFVRGNRFNIYIHHPERIL